MSQVAPRVERLHGGQPIIVKNEDHDWENKVTFNPAGTLVDDAATVRKVVRALPISNEMRERLAEQRALVGLLYRAQGTKKATFDHPSSSLGLAICSPRLDLLLRLDQPVVLPDQPYENLGVEDARITRVGDLFWMVYTGFSAGSEKNSVKICLASSGDLVHWTKHGLLRGDFNGLDNKNGMFFEPGAGERFMLLHRPMEGENAMMIHWAESKELLGEWKTRGALIPWMADPAFKDVWVGGGAPPLRLSDGRYLILYHIGNRDAQGKREYDLGLALFDRRKTDPIMKRLEPLMRPETPAETQGDTDLGVDNVVFSCAAYFWEGDLYIPYAGADTCVLGARISKADIERFVG